MGLVTVAEYVTDAETLKMVQGLAIDYVQGFAIAKPKPFRPIDKSPTASSPAEVVLNGPC